MCCALIFAWLNHTHSAYGQEIQYALPDSKIPISVSSDSVARWHSGKFEVMHLKGNIEITQDHLTARGDEAIVWVQVPDESNDPKDSETAYRVILYLEQNATITRGGESPSRISDDTILERLFTRSTVDLNAANKRSADQESPVYRLSLIHI